MLDDMVDYLRGIRERPVWRPIPDAVRGALREPVPRGPTALAEVHESFLQHVLPYAVGNAHPGFFGWVHGGGTPVGMLAEMLAGGLNANLGGRDQMPVEVERQVAEWARELFGFPAGASGLFVTGTSMANLLGVLVARTAALGAESRRRGLAASGGGALTAYASAAAHGSVARALDFAGLGSDALRLVGVDGAHRVDVPALERAIAADRTAGRRPFLIVGTAGTVDVGAIDDLDALARIAAREGMHLHVDGACAALAVLVPELAPRLRGIERADSIAFDFHKWGQVPYDAGFFLARERDAQLAAFAAPAAYLRRDTRGLAAGSPWPCDLGPDLSRGFRALKAWFTLKVLGTDALAEAIRGTCRLAQRLAARIEREPRLELLAPVPLNIVCFRHRGAEPDALNAAIVRVLHESGLAAPSTTVLDGRLAIRAAIVNHRTEARDIDTLVDAVLRFGAAGPT